ncbi:MAG TPA: hypothetical protein VM639_13050 [Dongiaceae bacterium]|nr:hypothetical protein [Dongiaceae bacterium]
MAAAADGAGQWAMDETISIRPVTAADYDGWKPLWDGYSAFYGRVGATALAPAVTAATWGRFLDADQPVHALVAERGARGDGGGELVGLAIICSIPPRRRSHPTAISPISSRQRRCGARGSAAC